MNDKLIINIISKTYFAIISFFIFIFLTLSISFIALKDGVFIKKLHIQNFELSELYINWDEKIDISLKELKISPKSKSTDTNLSLQELGKYFKIFSKTTVWFHSVLLERILYGESRASFRYKNGDNGFFVAHSKNIDINASLYFKNETMIVDLEHFYDKKRNLSIKGDSYFHTSTATIYNNFTIDIAKKTELTFYSIMDKEKMLYRVENAYDIKSIKQIIDALGFTQPLRYWVDDAIALKSLHVDDIHGILKYNDFNNAYKQLSVTARADKLTYRYNQKLEPIISSYTDLEFRDGVLYIRPSGTHTYASTLDNSWLKIDFTQKEELLTLHLLFDGSVDKYILNILKNYKIKLPFLQKSGITTTNLTLKVWLRSLNVDAEGDFFTKKANIDYLGLNLNVFDTAVHIKNNDVYIKKMSASYKDIATAGVVAHYNAKKESGEIDFKVQSVHAGKFTLSQPVALTYTIQASGKDTIRVKKSEWQIKSKMLRVDAMKANFSMKDLKLKIPSTSLYFEDSATALLSGVVDLNTTTAKLEAKELKFSYDGIELSKLRAPLEITYDEYFSLASKEPLSFSIAGTKYTTDKLSMQFQGDNVYLKHTLLHIGKYISTKIYINYNTETQKSQMSLNNFVLTDPNTQKVLYENKKILLSASIAEDALKVDSKELEAEFISKESGWKLYVNSIEKITRNSLFLQKYKIKDGVFNLYKNKKDQFTRFKSKLSYPYKILVKANTPLDEYSIKGKVYKEKISLLLNDALTIDIKDKIDIKAENTAINIKEVLRAIGDINSTKSESKMLDIAAKFTNSYLYVDKKRRVVYDAINLEYSKGELTANMDYKDGHSYLRAKGKKFHLYGNNFDDVFMNKLFALTNFNGGVLDFSIIGASDDYDGVFYVRESLLKDYKVLNNILAFVNTVPSLITFSLPGYNKEGLYLEKSYLKFNYKKQIMHISDIYLDSKELDIFGKGSADIKKDHLDLILNLKTDLGSDLAKVPLVGYLLLNGDTLSTTLSVKGKISNPSVSSLLAKEMIVAPFNLIKRTLLLPYQLFK